jgi:hypothetical protein
MVQLDDGHLDALEQVGVIGEEQLLCSLAVALEQRNASVSWHELRQIVAPPHEAAERFDDDWDGFRPAEVCSRPGLAALI